jgi:nicotinate-nucleotide adenylyltransferase
VGLLGGSFNPAHRGHLHISLEALRRLDLDEVWWLVAPQNPLKPVTGMKPLAERLATARAFLRHPRIKAVDLESGLGTRFTADTLARLTQRFPRSRFVWLMGADNLVQIPRWARWQDIFRLVPVAVFARPPYCLKAMAGLAAQRFRRFLVPARAVRDLATRTPPAWAFIPSRLDPSSATALRARQPKATTGPVATKAKAKPKR